MRTARGPAPSIEHPKHEPGWGGSPRPKGDRLVPLLTLREVAGLLNVSPKTIRRLVARGSLPCVRFGRVLRFQQADLFRFVEARKE